ncbi:MAG: hypothetical protein SFV32_05490 [Opitutaceae bacterium]|nr:hypothetical protein [Opitutaceae bacterium]
MNARKSLPLVVAGFVAGLSGHAQSVTLTNSTADLSVEATARYRLVNTNWDLSLYNEQPSPSPADFVHVDLGNVASLSGDKFRFSLKHVTNQGLIFTLSDNTDSAGPVGGRVAWGTFSPTLTSPGGPLAVKADLDGELPGFSFNAIRFETRAFSPDSSMDLTGLSFSGAASLSNSFVDSYAVYNNVGNSFVGSLLSDTDLSTFDWELTGYIKGVKLVTGGDELVALNLQMGTIPEPSFYGAVAGLATLAYVSLRRRRAQAS